jgi:hypothetical protein
VQIFFSKIFSSDDRTQIGLHVHILLSLAICGKNDDTLAFMPYLDDVFPSRVCMLKSGHERPGRRGHSADGRVHLSNPALQQNGTDSQSMFDRATPADMLARHHTFAATPMSRADRCQSTTARQSQMIERRSLTYILFFFRIVLNKNYKSEIQ